MRANVLDPGAPRGGAVRPYWLLLRAGFRSQAAYPLAAAAGMFTNAVFGVLKATVLTAAAAAAGGSLAGYSGGQLLAYVWVSQAMIGFVAAMGTAEIGERIRTGDIATDFTRPLDVQGAHLAADLGRSFFSVLPRGLPCLAIGALVTGMTLPAAAAPYVLGAVSLLLATVLSFLCRYAVAILGFWLVDTRGLATFYTVLSGFFMGLSLPVSAFPSWLRTIAHATPFPSVMASPVDVLIGRLTGPDAIRAIAVQAAWVVGIGLLGRVLTARGRRTLEVQGG